MIADRGAQPQTRPPDTPLLDVAELNAFMGRAFPKSTVASRGEVMEITPGRVLMRLPFDERNLRPGGVISGPTFMTLADAATYALIVAHMGDSVMAVTTSLTMHFLRASKPGALFAEAKFLKLGGRLATAQVDLWVDRPEALAAHATVAYALPNRH